MKGRSLKVSLVDGESFDIFVTKQTRVLEVCKKIALEKIGLNSWEDYCIVIESNYTNQSKLLDNDQLILDNYYSD